ncbi:lipid A oxidase [Rhizobium sp. Root274]|uniref:outer membrane protein n=1 Tax=unclassified Rhizobium TaxID=2613769 RepID=UPI0007145309|nr:MULTISPECIES: outer membrane beta-barrel protein [unclassified Rhizobium]KQW31569.1 lipid A oxidase [Rhizobium sp. Root1240]KRD33109.1 lipid A oxidase [Rhizobium sp. Root274]
MTSRAFPLALAGVLISALTSPAHAEMAISVYSGFQTAPHSDIDLSDGTDFRAGWEGKSFESPPYYGLRGTWWMDDLGRPNLGLSVDFSHSKVYADDETLASSGWSHFEFSDGLNLLTLNALYRMPIAGTKFVPYVGAGAGVNVPHVEVTRGSGKTFEYQFGGATLQAQAGVAYKFTKNWAAFLEYKGNYSWVDVDIDSGTTLKTQILTNAVNVGVSYKF